MGRMERKVWRLEIGVRSKGCGERKDEDDLDERMEMTWKVAEVREYAAVSTIDADRGLRVLSLFPAVL